MLLLRILLFHHTYTAVVVVAVVVVAVAVVDYSLNGCFIIYVFVLLLVGVSHDI